MSSAMDWLVNTTVYGLWDISILGLVAYTLITTHITIVGVTVYLHRHSAHRAVELHPVVQHFFRFWLWFTTGMVTKEWTAIHRKHHAVCETPEDPHSPKIDGINKILWDGVDNYKKSSRRPEIMEKYGSGCPDDWLERNIYTPHTVIGIVLLAIADVMMFGIVGISVWAIQMLWIPFFAAGVINGIGHYWGYRNYECPDAATNIVPWGIIIGGEELHNNHHTYPNSAKLSQKPWEFDAGWMWIRIFQTFGLAQPRSTGPVAAKVPGKNTLDADTAWAVLNDRFRVMARYAEWVVKPLLKQEAERTGSASRRLVRARKQVLCQEDSLVDEVGRNRIAELVGSSPVIKEIYEFRLRLHEIWTKRSAGAEALLKELHQWCVDAEESGIHALKEFAADLKSYTIPKLATA